MGKTTITTMEHSISIEDVRKKIELGPVKTVTTKQKVGSGKLKDIFYSNKFMHEPQGEVVVGMDDFTWLFRTEMYLGTIRDRLNKFVINQFKFDDPFTSLMADDELEEYLEALLGHTVVNYGFAFVKELVDGCRMERGVGNFKYKSGSGLFYLTNKSLKKLVKSGVRSELIREALELSHYVLTGKVDNKLDNKIEAMGDRDPSELTDDQRVAKYVEIKRSLLNNN
jgi:hypothetical protein